MNVNTKITKYCVIAIIILVSTITPGCKAPLDAPKSVVSDEPVVLDQGSVSKEPGYYVDESGRVIYTDSREKVGDSGASERNPGFPPLFPGAQRIYPAGENSDLRESYITRAPIEAIQEFYWAYLERGVMDPKLETTGEKSIVNEITSTDPDGRKQTALFINYEEIGEGEEQPPRAGMKILLKEFPAQHAVQIVLTTLSATPLGLNPVGTWITPEEAERLADDAGDEETE